jgi:hypothetical protein
MTDKQLLEFSYEIDGLLLDSCIKYKIDYTVMTAVVLARIVAISRQINSEPETRRLLSLAQSSIMETVNNTIQ